MVTVESRCRRVDGRTLVECRLHNQSEAPTRARVESRLDGPVNPPREDGAPTAGWSDGVWTGRVDAGACVGVGFATPAAPVDPPVRVETRPASGDDGRFGADPTPGAVARELSDPRPPRAALFDDSDDNGADDDGAGDIDAADDRADAADATADGPAAVDEWLADAATRVERLEALAAVETLPEATAAVAAADGLAGVRRLREQARDDRERLLELAGRAERLAGRIEAAEVPVETLERLS